MPIISTFFGIVIRMYYQDHEPAHFHAEYQGRQAKFTFDGELLAGDLSAPRAVSSVNGPRFIGSSCRRIGRGCWPANNWIGLRLWSSR
jgi:hypothetical protein